MRRSIFCGFLLASAMLAQTAPLDDLVAPIALYPDTLLAQVLAASTYPLEIVEAQQWLQQNRAFQGARLMDAARQQNWDPSVQALVAFPSVLAFLNSDIRWTTDLGNAFLSQQADLMDAVQRMRVRARDNGRLVSTPQHTVSGESTIEIQPANPQVVYVPSYNPAYVWGPGAYPPLGYGAGFGFNPAVLIGALFSGLLSFGGWGWGLNWLLHGLFLNNLFFGHFGFGGGGLGAHSLWAHNPGHRLGVAYPNRMVASRFAGARPYQSYNRAYNRSPAPSHYSAPARSYRSSNYREAAPRMSSPRAAPRVSRQSHSSHFKAPRSKGHSGKHR
ncbi:MAG: DUF3300 domain-containing protein [Bryobacteraceae bacterium]